MKTCRLCKQEKELTEFPKQASKPDGLRYECKICHNAANTAARAANPEKHRKTNLAYARSPEGRAVQRANNLRRKFWSHMTNEEAVAEYDRILAEQKNCCALCGVHQGAFKVALAVDHDHKTGQVRGLLCNKCNRFEVGRHTLESARQMLTYFEKYQ